MRILIACEESQRTCLAFRKFGFDAFSCDIKDCSGGHPEYHIKADVLSVIYDNWDLIIAHPPCTYLTNAAAVRLFPNGILDIERYKLGLQAKEFFLKIYNAPCKHICIENPLPNKIFDLPLPSQIIQPYYFGHPFSKRTLLWLKNLPFLFPTNILYDYVPFVGCKNSVAHSAAQRSKTFCGISFAMAEQFGGYLKNL